MSIDDDDVRIRRCADARHDGVIPAERNRWFAGKYMAARDFALDPEYLRGHQLLHNRLLHGQGVVCGLTVHPHPREECRDGWVVVRAGIGIDCHGREVVLREDTAFRLPDAPDAAATAGGQPATRPE